MGRNKTLVNNFPDPCQHRVPVISIRRGEKSPADPSNGRHFEPRFSSSEIKHSCAGEKSPRRPIEELQRISRCAINPLNRKPLLAPLEMTVTICGPRRQQTRNINGYASRYLDLPNSLHFCIYWYAG